METGLTERTWLRQSPYLVNSRYVLTTSESDLIYALLTEIKKKDKDFKDYVFSIQDLEKKIGKVVKVQQLKNTAYDLMDKVIEIKYEKGRFQFVNWLSFFEYNQGIITCRIDKRMKELLLELQQYVLADIKHLTRMKSHYSKRIYLMLKERKDFGERKFDVEEMMNLFKVPKSLQNYAQFKQKVLNQAVKEINLYSDIKIEFEAKKMGRKVKSVIFKIKKNEEQLKEFISAIRECYTNVDLFNAPNGEMLQCSQTGYLYYKDDIEANISKVESEKLWKWLHQHREKLYCFQNNLLDIISD